MKSHTKTLTEGPLAKQIFLVSLPLALSNLLQVQANRYQELINPYILVKVLLKRFILTNSRIISIMPRKDIRLMPETSFYLDKVSYYNSSYNDCCDNWKSKPNT